MLAGRPGLPCVAVHHAEPRPARYYPVSTGICIVDDLFWQHRFLALPDFEPMRLPEAGRGGIPQLGLDALIAFLLSDIFA